VTHEALLALRTPGIPLLIILVFTLAGLEGREVEEDEGVSAFIGRVLPGGGTEEEEPDYQ
jgi:hypothetical protein